MVSKGFHDLVRRAQAGDRRAMDQVLETLRPHLERLAHAYANPARPVESTSDLVQKSCLRAWQGMEDFEGGKDDEQTFGMFRAWIGRIVRNLGLNSQRDLQAERRRPAKKILAVGAKKQGQTTRHGGGLDPPAPDPTPSAQVRGIERAQQVRDALAGLSDQMAAGIVRMHFFEGLPLREIAERLGLTHNQVRDRYRASMRRLEEYLGGTL